MTVISGNIEDIGYQPLSGTLTATSVDFRSENGVLVAPETHSWPINAGNVSATLLPGPARLTITVGTHARDTWDVIVPDTDVTLGTLIDDSIEWAPPIVSIVGEHRRAAEAAAARAEQAADDVDAAIAGAADQVVQAVEADRVAAEQAASDAAGSASAAASSEVEAASSAQGAAQSESAAAGSASDAAGSASDASSSASDASSSESAAAGSATAAAGSASDAASSASVAAGHASAAGADADRAQQYADSFGLSVTTTTGAPGTPAQITVTGDGPAYEIGFTVPQGEQGDPGPPGEVSQAMLDAAVASLVDNAPEALDTLQELADALGNDPNFATTVSAQIGERAKTSDVNAALAGKADVGAEDTATWAGVSGKPATFPPTTGSTASTAKPGDWLPTWAEVSGKPSTFPPTIGSTAATAKAGDYVPAWSEVTGKPSTFTPATHTHTKSEVGLGNVDNTSDADKPVSTATQAALTPLQSRVGAAPATWRWNGTSLPTAASQVHAQARVGDFIVAPNLTVDPGWHQITGV